MDIYKEKFQKRNILEYNFRSGIVALELYNTMMRDYDTEKKRLLSEQIKKNITKMVNYSKTLRVIPSFTYFTTDRYIHLF